MSSQFELERKKKLDALVALGVDPYGHRFADAESAAQIREKFAAQGEGAEAVAAGRLLAMRKFGKLAFADVVDQTGRLQVCFNRDELGSQFDVFKQLDLGDIVGVSGKRFSATSER